MRLEDHLEKLKAFKIIVESGSMKAAALKLNLAQPSLTRLVQTLEASIGAKLLDRGRKGVAPTAAGKLVMAFASDVLKNLLDLEEKIKNPQNPHSGHLIVGSYETLVESLWPDFLVSFQKTTPNLKISLRTSLPANSDKMLEEGLIDLRVDAEPRTTGEFTSWKLYEDKFNLYTSSALSKKNIENATLIYCYLALDRKNKSIIQHLDEMGYVFKQKIELDSFTSVRAFCLKGLGVGVLPNRLGRASVESKHLEQLSSANIPFNGFGPHDIVATVASSRSNDPPIRTLVRALREWFKSK